MEGKSIGNLLYPVFFRLDKLRILIVGAGMVGEEKLRFILKSSPNARIKIVAKEVLDARKIIEKYPDNILVEVRAFEPTDAKDADIVIAATADNAANIMVYESAKHYGKIVNVADSPELCDFYMGSIVTRGDLKIAISTNGKSPTFAKRFRQLLEDILPKESNDLIQNLKIVRDRLQGDFEYKVKELNRITETLI